MSGDVKCKEHDASANSRKEQGESKKYNPEDQKQLFNSCLSLAAPSHPASFDAARSSLCPKQLRN